MNFLVKNSLLTIKKLKQIVIRDILKSPVINYFGDDYPENVLISYITRPFRKGIDLSHTNSAEVLEIAKVFRSLSFKVDIADYNYEGFLDYDKYNVIFGFGEPLVNSYTCPVKKRIIRIYYGTGMHVIVQNNNTLRRIEEVYRKKGIWLTESGRIVEKTWSQQTNIVDAMIVLGNDRVKESYRKFYDKNIFILSPSFYKIFDFKEIIDNKDFSEAKRNFIWFGGRGLIHKGLDLLLEAFKTIPDFHLHICGPTNSETEFRKIYQKELYETPNVHSYGFIKIDSPLFRQLTHKCAFIINPSCSEGGGAAVLNISGNGGLIPIISGETSIDVHDYGFIIKSLSVEEIKNSVQAATLLTNEELREKSLLWAKYLAEKNSIEAYSKNIKRHLQTILNENEL